MTATERSTVAEPVVATTGGSVRGRTVDGIARFLGIPYADAPFGPRRFAAPQPLRWDDVREAVQPAPTAPQPVQGFTIIPEPIVPGGAEPACLALNVFSPDPSSSAALPVLVWFHGGGFTQGTASSSWYDGRRFCRDGVVVVSVGYRLGAEGFLRIDGAPDNRAVLDWLAALTWVRDNIARFGGDPDAVTIGGQSAGSAACLTLATLDAGAGLFRSVIAASGAPRRTPSAEVAGAVAAAVAEQLGKRPTVAELSTVSADELMAAQTAGASTAVARLRELGLPNLGMAFQPHLDGAVMTRDVGDAVRDGRTDHLPMLIGATAQETTALAAGTDVDDETLHRRLVRMGLDDGGIAAHVAHVGGSNGAALGQAVTDSTFRVPALRVAQERAARGAPTFHYDFRWSGTEAFGAVHCLDLPFAWDLLDADAVAVVAGQSPPQHLADAVHSAWVRFITDGDPGWPALTPGNEVSMVFDDRSAITSSALALEASIWP